MAFRKVGGLRCDQVLEALDRYVDDQLTEVEQVMVQAHVRGCDNCRRFGGAYARVVVALRGPANPPMDDPMPPGLLRRALAGVAGAGGER
jgi:anti-sigma factor RsiW